MGRGVEGVLGLDTGGRRGGGLVGRGGGDGRGVGSGDGRMGDWGSGDCWYCGMGLGDFPDGRHVQCWFVEANTERKM